MLRDILRTIGTACIIAGIALYFMGASSGNGKDDVDKVELLEEISILQDTLNRTEEELAKLQLATSAAEGTTKEEDTDKEKDVTDTKSSTQPIIKTLLHIEPGATSSSVSYQLERSGIINHAKEFDDYLTTNELSNNIQIGEYELDSSMSVNKIAEMITK